MGKYRLVKKKIFFSKGNDFAIIYVLFVCIQVILTPGSPVKSHHLHWHQHKKEMWEEDPEKGAGNPTTPFRKYYRID